MSALPPKADIRDFTTNACVSRSVISPNRYYDARPNLHSTWTSPSRLFIVVWIVMRSKSMLQKLHQW